MGEVLRVLHIVHILNRGGMESRIMDLYRHIDKQKYQFDFYVDSSQKGVFDSEIESIGGRVYYATIANRNGLPSFRAFNHFLKEHREFGIVYAYNQWAGSYLRIAKKNDVTIRVAYSRTSLDTRSLKNTIKNIVKLNVNKYATHKFAVSKKAGKWLFGSNAMNNNEVIVWPNAIDAQCYAFNGGIRNEVRDELELNDKFVVTHVGNIRLAKNHPFLLDVFSEIRKINKDAVLLLVGNGSLDSLKEQIDRLGIRDSIVFLGVRGDVPRLLQAGDVFVFPSIYEGFPGAVLEAQASGLWCLVSDAVTDEIELTDHIERISLSQTSLYWAKKALSYGIVDRDVAWKGIVQAGYDINQLATQTEDFFGEVL